MIQSNSFYVKFKQVYYGVERAHNILGLRDPLKSPLLIALGNGPKRTLPKPVCKKEPIASLKISETARRKKRFISRPKTSDYVLLRIRRNLSV